MAGFGPVIAEVVNPLQIRAQLPVRIHLETGLLQPLQRCPLVDGLSITGQMQGVSEEVEPPGGHHFWIELPQGSGAGVAGVGEQGLTALVPLGVDRRKRAIRDEGLTTHLHPFRRIFDLQAQRNRTDGAHIRGDLFTAAAISPGGSSFEHAMPVTEGQGVAVDLQLAHHLQGCVGGSVQNFEKPLVPGAEVVAVEGVVEAEQTNAVLHAAEPICRCSSHALGGAIGSLQAGIRLLELQEFAVEAVVDRVFHHRSIENVIGVSCPIEQLTQLGRALLRISHSPD